jgi:two-component system, LuxR family, sensor histidine kinase DctS
VQVEWAVAPVLPRVDADPVLIEQVVLNLVRNACDEMAGVPAAQRRLRVAIARAGAGAMPGAGDAEGFLRLDVDDAGPGLRGRSVEQLVTPFYSTKPDGMGMGLAICRSIIEAHHGAFDAAAGPLGGARFSFTLPVAGAWPSSRLAHDDGLPAAHTEDLP